MVQFLLFAGPAARVRCFRIVAVVLATGLPGGLAGCGGATVEPTEPAEDPTPLYWRLTLNQQAINLSTAAPYDTFRLVATPRALDGAPLKGPVTVHFTSRSPEEVQVSPDGLVRGLAEATRAEIRVTLTHGLVTHLDSAYVRVTSNPTPPVLAQLVLEPDPPDSAKGTVYGGGGTYYREANVVPRAFDAAGNPLATQGNQSSNLLVWVKSSDPMRVPYSLDFSRVQPFNAPGPVTFYANTVAYGVERADTLNYMLGLQLYWGMSVETRFTTLGGVPTYRFNPVSLTVGTGAYALWQREQNVPAYDVTFEDPTYVAADTVRGSALGCGATAGHIVPFGDTTGQGNANLCTRYFPVPRTYRYYSTALNASGTVVVVDESQTASALSVAVVGSPAARPSAMFPTWFRRPVPSQSRRLGGLRVTSW